MIAAELRLKNLSDDPEEKAKLEEIIKNANTDMKAALASVQSEDQENEKKVDDNKDKIIAEYDKAIADLEKSKEGKEGRDLLATDMKIVGFKMQKAKLEKDTEKVDLFKGKLRDLRTKISELGDEEPKKPETTEEPAKEEPAKEEPAKNSKEDKLSRIENLLKKAEESGDEAKIQKIKDLKDKIAAKESWQLEGTELSRLFEMEIKKLEMSFLLNESLSVKDSFSRLI
jgi:DNA-binding protein Fis